MSVLSDRDIRERLKKGDLVIRPMEESQIGPSSVDFRLGTKFRIFQTSSRTHIDPILHKNAGDYTTLTEITDGRPFIVHPGEFVLGSVLEYIKIPSDLIGILHGRSSLGRLGIMVHATAGFVEPGYYGNLTLEISNISRIPIALYPQMRVCQIILQKLSSPAERPADKKEDSKYVGEKEPGFSKISTDKELEK